MIAIDDDQAIRCHKGGDQSLKISKSEARVEQNLADVDSGLQENREVAGDPESCIEGTIEVVAGNDQVPRVGRCGKNLFIRRDSEWKEPGNSAEVAGLAKASI